MRGSGGRVKDAVKELARRPGCPGRGGPRLIWELRRDKLRGRPSRRAWPDISVSHRHPCSRPPYPGRGPQRTERERAPEPAKPAQFLKTANYTNFVGRVLVLLIKAIFCVWGFIGW